MSGMYHGKKRQFWHGRNVLWSKTSDSHSDVCSVVKNVRFNMVGMCYGDQKSDSTCLECVVVKTTDLVLLECVMHGQRRQIRPVL
jgi:hypothetical protein